MDSNPLLNDQDDAPCFSTQRDGYVIIQARQLRECPNLEKELKYPRKMDPFKINNQIILLSIVIVIICLLFGISFTLRLFIQFKYIEFGICGIVCVQFSFMIFYYYFSISWCEFLSDSGYYSFPKKILLKRTVVIFVWGIVVFFLSPVLLSIKTFCDDDKSFTEPEKCLWILSNFQLMQAYLGIGSFLVLCALCWHLCVVIRFKIQRRWPDIWHERLLEESALVGWCPLIKLSELRVDLCGESGVIDHHRATRPPTVEEIMQTQAFVIGYLRKLNSSLGARISDMTRDQGNDLVTRVAVVDDDTIDRGSGGAAAAGTDDRGDLGPLDLHHHQQPLTTMDSSSLASSSMIRSFGSRRGQVNYMLS